MTLKDLSQLYYLKKEIELDKQRLAALRMKANSPSAPNYSDIPHSSSYGNYLEKIVADMLELDEIIENKIKRCISEQIRLEKYIETIPDSHMRMIFTLRFIEHRTWRSVAMKIGGGNTEHGVKVAAGRYINKHITKEERYCEAIISLCGLADPQKTRSFGMKK